MDNMDNQNLEVAQPQDNEEQVIEQTVEDNQTVNQTNQGDNGTDTVNQTANLEEWQKDSRYGKMWHKADDLYNSYKSMEKSYQEVNPKYKQLLTVLKDNGFKSETLSDELKKYADYRDPNSRINQVYNYIDKLLQNELYSGRVQQFFEQIEAEELQRLYPNMSAEQIKKQQELEQKLQKLEAEQAQRQSQADYQKEIDGIQKGFQECEELAKEYGFKITQEVKNYLFTHCGENNIDPKYLKSEFINIYGKQLREARDKKILANYNARKQKLQDAQIISGGASKTGNFAPTGDAKSRLKLGLEKILGR